MGGSAWSNPGPASQVIIAGPSGELFVYSASNPALGNLLAAISGAAGTDPYGNGFEKGITLIGHNGQVLWFDPAGNPLAFLPGGLGIIQEAVGPEVYSLLMEAPQPGNFSTNPALLKLFSNHKFRLESDDLTVIPNSGLGIGVGPVGPYYQERLTFDTTQIYTTAVIGQCSHYSRTQLRGTASWALASGTWTCQNDGPYRHAASIEFANTWVGGSRLRINWQKNGSFLTENDVSQVGATGRLTHMFEDDFAAGDTLTLNLDQFTGVNQKVTANSFVHSKRTT